MGRAQCVDKHGVRPHRGLGSAENRCPSTPQLHPRRQGEAQLRCIGGVCLDLCSLPEPAPKRRKKIDRHQELQRVRMNLDTGQEVQRVGGLRNDRATEDLGKPGLDGAGRNTPDRTIVLGSPLPLQQGCGDIVTVGHCQTKSA